MKKQKSDLISILMPAFNAEKHIEKAIDSVKKQDWKNWELLIVNDGSTDNTKEVIRVASENDKRIKGFNIKNSGPANARRFALNKAKGRYIAFLDSDDFWLEQKLSSQVRIMNRDENVALSFTAFRRVTCFEEKTGRLITVPETLDHNELLRNTVIATSTVIIDREKTGSFVIEDFYYDDFALWLSILRKGKLAVGINKDLMRYRVCGASVSRNKFRSILKVWDIYKNKEKLSTINASINMLIWLYNGFKKYRRF